MRWLRAIQHRLSPRAPASLPPLPRCAPPVCVIGDLHGRLDLLEAMLAEIATRADHAQARLVLTGDMIDRGPDSAGVLTRLFALQTAAPERVICLMGNHERMALDFLADPARHGPRWIAAGGSETLTSLGLSPWTRKRRETSLQELADALQSALGADMIDWLHSLPLIWQDGQLAVTHAGADPALPLEAQSKRRMLWGARKHETPRRRDGIWVAQGHTIVEEAHARAQCISVDTGAWRTGRLSAAWIDAEGLSFVNVSGEK